MPPIYHFTHGSNLQPILAEGELRAQTAAATVVDIANASIKRSRTTRQVGCGPGGYVEDYVPFDFAPRSPTLGSISQGRVEGVDPDQRPVAYFVTSTERVLAAGLSCVFSDGNAATAITSFFDDLDLLADRVDWALTRSRRWGNTAEDPDRMRRRQAEFLVHGVVPLELFDELAVYDEAVGARVLELVEGAGLALPVRVRRDWYF